MSIDLQAIEARADKECSAILTAHWRETVAALVAEVKRLQRAEAIWRSMAEDLAADLSGAADQWGDERVWQKGKYDSSLKAYRSLLEVLRAEH